MHLIAIFFLLLQVPAPLPPLGPQPLVTAPLQITTTSCPTITPGVAYQCQFQATGGTPPYHWSIISGTPPVGLTMSDSGLLSGTVYICSPIQITNCITPWPTSLQLIMAGHSIDIPVAPPPKKAKKGRAKSV